jgi:hypothetical protein
MLSICNENWISKENVKPGQYHKFCLIFIEGNANMLSICNENWILRKMIQVKFNMTLCKAITFISLN